MSKYFEKIIKGTEQEDAHVISQFLKGMVGKRFSFLNHLKGIPVSYAAKLLGIENEMAEFEVHEYQAKIISEEHQTLIHSHELSPFREDIAGQAFYVSIAKKRVILNNFSYARIHSNMRRFVRVMLDREAQADLILEDDILSGNIIDISIGGAAVKVMSREIIVPGLELNLFLKLPDLSCDTVVEIGMSAKVVAIAGDDAPYTCFLELHPDKHSQQQLACFINQRQVEIIKELKELKS